MAAPAKPAKATKYSKLDPVHINIGLQVVYPNADEPSSKASSKPGIDIVAIPGLGANPEWTWVRDKVHWLRDSNMLARKVPNARISVFQFQSQWFGKGAVDQRLENVADQLLYQLKGLRGDNNKTPIIFISHCMGGIILERALLTSRLRQNDFPSIFPSVAGCIFLGTPFRGTQTQSKAVVLAQMAETIGMGVSSSLLKLLEKDSEVLLRMLDDFVRLVNDAQIRVFCFFESERSDIAAVLIKKLPFKQQEVVVDQESATWPGVENLQLASDHFKLNKYSGPKDGNFVSVSNEIKVTATKAAHIIKSRQNTVRQALINDRTYHALIDTLGRGFTDLIATMKGSYTGPVSDKPSWVIDVDSYKQWMGQDTSQLMWIHGKAGTGQGAIASSVIRTLDKTKDSNSIVASFFCDQADESRRSLRSMLKLLIRQIIDASQNLAVHLLTDSKNAKTAGKQDYDPEALNKIPALWEALQSMAMDIVGGRIYLVIYGLDQLSKESLEEFLEHMKEIPGKEATIDDDAEISPIKWMLLSRSGRPDIDKALKAKSYEVNIDDSENAEHRSDALRSTISARVDDLQLSRPLTYFVKRHIHSRAEDNYIYVNLVIQELKNAWNSGIHKHSEIRAMLESLPFGLTDMFEHIRRRVLSPNADGIEYTKEIVRCLILARRAPTLRELAIMADLPLEEREDQELLKGHVIRCGAFVTLRGNEYDEDTMTVEWIDPAAKEHLEKYAKDALALDGEQKDVQHGIIALRCLEYVYSVTEIYEAAEAAKRAKEEEENEGEPEDGEEKDEDAHDDDDEDKSDAENASDADDATTDAEDKEEHEFDKGDALMYPVQYWLEHAKLAPVDVIVEFKTGHSFWKDDSPARQDWWSVNDSMHVYPNQTNVSALHVAAIAQFPALLDHLLNNGWQQDVDKEDSSGSQPLYCACAVGNYEIVETLLNVGADINYVSHEDNVPALHAAASRGHLHIVELLLDRDADININSTESGSALYAACQSDHMPVIKLLVERKADVNLVGYGDQRAFNWVAWNGNEEAVRLLLDNGVDIDPEQPDYWYGSALGDASRRGHAEIAKILLSRGWSPSRPMKTYGSFLTCAATYGHLGVVEELVQKEARITVLEQALAAASQNGKAAVVKTILEKTPTLRHQKAFMLAADYGRDDVLKLLFPRGISQEKLDEALFLSSDHEHESTVKLLLDFGASPNAEGPFWGCALTASAYDGTTEIMKALIEKGADVNKRGGEYGNPLQAAAWYGDAENVQLLLDYGAIVNTEACGKYGHALTGCNDEETIRLLLENGADVNAHGGEYGYAIVGAVEDVDGDALRIYLEHGANVNVRGGDNNAPIIATAGAVLDIKDCELILDHGADINDADDNGTTALINCADAGDAEGLQVFLSRGADIFATSTTFGTALHAAAQAGDEDCCKVLLDAGAEVNAVGGPHGTPLQAAASAGDLETVQMLLEARADAKGKRGVCGTYGTPLQAACFAGSLDVVRELVEHGAVINMQPANGKHGYPLHAAAAAGAIEVVEYLLENGADVHLEGGEHGYALLAAAQKEWNFSVVHALLEHGADVKVQGGILGSAAAAAASVNNQVVLDTLIEAGADVHVTGGKFGTALQAVARRATDMECYNILFQRNVNVNATGGKYLNALIAAAYFDRTYAVDELIDRGADITIRGGKYMNAVAAAAMRGNKSILEKLLKMDPPGQLLDDALVEACAHRQSTSVELLLKSGANVYAQHPILGTALDALKAEQADGYNSDDEQDDLVEDEDEESDDEDEDDEDDEFAEEKAASVESGSVLDLQLEDEVSEEAKIQKLLDEAMARVRRNPSIKRFRTVKRGGLPNSLKAGPPPQMPPPMPSHTSFQQFNPPNANGPNGPQPQFRQQFSDSPRSSFQAYPGSTQQGGGYQQQGYPPPAAAPYGPYSGSTNGSHEHRQSMSQSHQQATMPQGPPQAVPQGPPHGMPQSPPLGMPQRHRQSMQQPVRHPSQQSLQYPPERPSSGSPQPQQMPQRVPVRTPSGQSPARKPVPGTYQSPPPGQHTGPSTPPRQYSSSPGPNAPQLPPRTGSQEQVSHRYSMQPSARQPQPLNPGPSGRYQQQQPQRQSYASPQPGSAYPQPPPQQQYTSPPPQNAYASPPPSTYNSPPMYNTPPPTQQQQYSAPPPPSQYNAPPSQYQSQPPSQYNSYSQPPPSQDAGYAPYGQSSQSSQSSFQSSQYANSSQYTGSQQGMYGSPNSSQASGFSGQTQGQNQGQGSNASARRWGGGGYDGEGYG